MIDQNNDQTSTITIGNTVINTNLNHNLNNLNSNLNKDDSIKDDLFNGFGVIERNLRYIFQQLSYIIKTRFQSSSSIFAPTICFIITFVYFINCLSSRASNDLDKEEFHKTESIVSSTLTLVPGKYKLLKRNCF